MNNVVIDYWKMRFEEGAVFPIRAGLPVTGILLPIGNFTLSDEMEGVPDRACLVTNFFSALESLVLLPVIDWASLLGHAH